MPRKPRFYLPGVPAHVFQRGHNQKPVFFDTWDFQEYLRCLKMAADQYGCAIHAYVLMTNHIHLLLTPQDEGAISSLFQAVGRDYVSYVNRKYRRRGGLWEGRHKGNIVESTRYFMRLMYYIEMNPVRAGIVDHPSAYRWSSYGVNAEGESSAIVKYHDEYLALGNTPAERCAAYRVLFEEYGRKNSEDELHLIRVSASSGTPLGSESFRQGIEELSGRKIGGYGRGRPTRQKGSDPF